MNTCAIAYGQSDISGVVSKQCHDFFSVVDVVQQSICHNINELLVLYSARIAI